MKSNLKVFKVFMDNEELNKICGKWNSLLPPAEIGAIFIRTNGIQLTWTA